ncbi:hypothetical protein EDC14_1004161 [Hydrogenispora ethanolica]|jgi:hypothetical protein|uniref:Uncharacterized protein n=1 Tax=Hydrogenispora ethanolica TaxID=1082276 RepID=A0A4R1S4L0_HYDET|nr:hypothetical protein [Hydrogenispora ethanolica]TCL74223.1 hypothetical protein EDC14_1004161 [Hydrogenispora ethanolica]
MNKEFLTGIVLNDKTPFLDWALSIVNWLNEVLDYVQIDEDDLNAFDTPQLLERQRILCGYLGTLVEPYGKAETYLKVALARSIKKCQKAGMPPSIAKIAAEEECENETKIQETIHRLNTAIAEQLKTIATRLSYEKSLMWGNGGRNILAKPPF